MDNLEHFSSGVALSPCSSTIFYLRDTGSYASLPSMELQVIGDGPAAVERRDPDEIESSTLQVPQNLRRLALEVPIGSAAQRSFVRHLLRTCAPTLRALSLTIDGCYLRGVIWEHFLPPDADFTHLGNLAIECEALAHPSLQRAVNVRHLKLLGWRTTSLGSDVLPNLCSLSCPADQLSAFLPPCADHRRPIATVSIGQASYRSPPEEDSLHRREPARWRAVFASLQHLRYSAVPVTSLTVDVAAIPAAGVHAAQPYLTALEYLDIVVHMAYDPVRAASHSHSRRHRHAGKHATLTDTMHRIVSQDALYLLASELITHLPRLHTLLISKAQAPLARTHGPSFGEAELELTFPEALRLSRTILTERLEDKPSALRRFALSADIEWRKNDDGWHWAGDPRYYRALGGSLDDPDCQDRDASRSKCDDESADESEREEYGSSDDESIVTVGFDSGYEDEGEDVDEAPEDTRSLPLDVRVDDDGTRYQNDDVDQ